jgi:hypothetical protein
MQIKFYRSNLRYKEVYHKRRVKLNYKKRIKNLELHKKQINDFNKQGIFCSYFNFCVKNYEIWKEERSIYLKEEFCVYGDLLDYLQKLEREGFVFSNDFYWDLFFEMICVRNYF